MLTRRLSYLPVACCLLVLLAGLGGHVTAQGGSPSLVLKFPAVRDFGGVQGKVLYVSRDLPAPMPLRFADSRVEAVPGFFPAGACVSVLSAGTRLGSAVSGEDGLSVMVPPPPVDGALEVVESNQPVPVSGTCIKVKSTGGALYTKTESAPWSPPVGTVRIVRAHVKAVPYLPGWPARLYGWDGVSWRELRQYGSSVDEWVDIPAGITQLKTRSDAWGEYWWIDVPEVEVEEEASSP